MHGIFFALLLTLFTAPASWKATTAAPDAKVLTTKTFGKVVAQYTTATGGIVQVRRTPCTDTERCNALADVGGDADDYVNCYCRGSCAVPKLECASTTADASLDWGGNGWARSNKAVGSDKVVHVFVVDRSHDEKAGYAFTYVGPKSGVAEFIAATDKLKTSATPKPAFLLRK